MEKASWPCRTGRVIKGIFLKGRNMERVFIGGKVEMFTLEVF
mgnify:CR=1 FL=1